MATEDRARALESAHELMRDNRIVGVKVCKETLDEETREFKSVTIFADGVKEMVKKKKDNDEDEAPLCVAPSDLYTVHARERIGRLLDGWLNRKQVTPFELLHRADLV
jgi:hypothetical protein